MPIKIPDGLPARAKLVHEGVPVLSETDAVRQDIRPLQIGLLNLMPDKIRTETQMARLLGASPLQIELTLIRVESYTPRNTSPDHLISFYQDWSQVQNRKFDGFIITGAPVETYPFQSVAYWPELTRIFNWTRHNTHSGFFICWGAMAALHHFHGVPKQQLPEKAFGIYRHRNLAPDCPYLSGFSDDCLFPVSRWSTVRHDDLAAVAGLNLLMDSEVTGPCLLAEPGQNNLYCLNHIEYDSTSLAEEYERDRAAGGTINPPVNYYPGDDAKAVPRNRWRSHAHLLFGNWINQVYQTTPYDIDHIGT